MCIRISVCMHIGVRACLLTHSSCVQLCTALWTVALMHLCPWDPPVKNPGVGFRALLQGIFPNQGSNPCILHPQHRQAGRLRLVPPGKPV